MRLLFLTDGTSFRRKVYSTRESDLRNRSRATVGSHRNLECCTESQSEAFTTGRNGLKSFVILLLLFDFSVASEKFDSDFFVCRKRGHSISANFIPDSWLNLSHHFVAQGIGDLS